MKVDSNFSLDDGFVIISESHEETDAKVLKNVATNASKPLYDAWFRNPGRPDRIKLRRKKMEVNNKYSKVYRAYPSLHPFGVVHWVPEQLNIKAVTEACKLIDGCSLELCLATSSVASSGICHSNKINSIA